MIPVIRQLVYRDRIYFKGVWYVNMWVMKVNYGNFFGKSLHVTKPTDRMVRKCTKQVKQTAQRWTQQHPDEAHRLYIKE